MQQRMMRSSDPRGMKKLKEIIGPLIESGVKTFTISFTCNNCNHTWREDYGILSISKFFLFGTKCPNCNKKDYNYEYVSTLLCIAIGVMAASLGLGLY